MDQLQFAYLKDKVCCGTILKSCINVFADNPPPQKNEYLGYDTVPELWLCGITPFTNIPRCLLNQSGSTTYDPICESDLFENY